MAKIFNFAVGSLVGMTMLFAADPSAASLSSAKPFQLRGETVIVDGVPTWPVMAGDDIATPAGDAVLQLRNGSRLTVVAGSRIRMEKDDSGLLVRVLSGAVRVLNSTPEFRIFLQNKLAPSSTGSTVGVAPAQAQASTARDLSSSLAARLPRPVSRR